MSTPLAQREPWDLVAAGYAERSEWILGAFAERATELADLRPNSRVIDVACGPGTVALRVAPKVATVTAVDFSEPMLNELRTRARQRNVTNVEVIFGDGQALPVADASYDAAFSMFGLMFFPDRARGLSELHRALVPGGVAVVSSWAPISDSSMMTVMFGALRAADPSRNAPQYDALSLENPALLEQELQAAGFRDVSVVPHVHHVELTEGPDELWDGMVRSSAPIALLRKRLGEQEWAVQEAKARAYLAQELRGARQLDTKAWLGRGYKP